MKSAGAQPELPSDYWHSYVYVNFGWLCCARCEVEPNLAWAWDGLESGERGAQLYAIRVVPHLLDAGWMMRNDLPYCAACAALLGKSS